MEPPMKWDVVPRCKPPACALRSRDRLRCHSGGPERIPAVVGTISRSCCTTPRCSVRPGTVVSGPGCWQLSCQPCVPITSSSSPGSRSRSHDQFDQFAMAIFLVMGGFISWLGEVVLRANRQLEKYARGIANQRDISEKCAAELHRLNESLRQSEERYRSLAIATVQIVWTTNANGKVVEDMPMWRALTGKSEEELRGWGWVDSLHPEDRERTRAVWSVAVRARSVYETEYRICKSDGEYRHFAVRGVPVLQADGSVREWVGTCTDITERKGAQEKLRRCRTSSTLPTTPSSSATGTVPSDPGTGAMSRCTAGPKWRPWVASLTIPGDSVPRVAGGARRPPGTRRIVGGRTDSFSPRWGSDRRRQPAGP